MNSKFELRLDLNDKDFSAYVLEDTLVNSKNNLVKVRCPELMPDMDNTKPKDVFVTIHKKNALKNSKDCTPVDNGDKLLTCNYLIGKVNNIKDEVVDIDAMYTSLDKSLSMSKANIKKEVMLHKGDKITLFFEHGKFTKPCLKI